MIDQPAVALGVEDVATALPGPGVRALVLGGGGAVGAAVVSALRSGGARILCPDSTVDDCAALVRDTWDAVDMVIVLAPTVDNADSAPSTMDGFAIRARELVSGLASVMSSGGSLVSVTTAAGVRGTAGHWRDAAENAAMAALTRCLAVELGPARVRVNQVAVAEHLLSHPDQISAAILFLAGPLAAGVNAETLIIDGGQ